MAKIIEMPKLSDTMTEGVVAAWHKKVGDAVKSGELMAEIETDKATMELESFETGTLLYVGVEQGGTVPVGGLLAIVGAKGEDVTALVADFATKGGAKSAAPAKQETAPVVETVAVAETAVSSNGNGDSRIKASPLAKAMAREAGIDLQSLAGTGDGGRIVKSDIESLIKGGGQKKAAAVPTFAPVVGKESYSEVPVSQMRKTIARRLTESKNGAPHFYLTMEIDMENAVKARQDINEIAATKISFNDIVIKAVAAALRQHPKVNASWLGDRIRYNDHIHIGMAVAMEDGLIVPVIRFADSLGLTQISQQARSLAERARNKQLQPADWEGNTFTISNLGMYGIEAFTAIINPPDACILAVGGIQDVPVVKNGAVVPGKTMKVTLSCDHRVVDGALGSEFLRTLKQYLENPVRILI
jgi:pyruvate dehydrogenase E2 component (dihydrolipoamide acetyltransferase)